MDEHQAIFQLTDDDGVFVVSSLSHLRAMCPASFDYKFPGILLDALRRGAAIAWQAPEESLSQFDVRIAPTPTACSGQMVGFVSCDEGEPLIFTTWSTFTLAMHFRAGIVDIRPGLAEAVAVPPGWYAVYVEPPVAALPNPDYVSLEWRVELISTSKPPPSALGALEIVRFSSVLERA